MRVIVVGASGVVGREILAGLANEQAIDEVISLTDSRSASDRAACAELGIECRRVDLRADFTTHLCYSDAVVYAGWPISDSCLGPPGSGYLKQLATVCDCVANAGVKAFVFGSSALGYSEAPADESIDEGWPLAQSSAATTVRQIVFAEELVNEFEAKHEITRVVVLRPAIIVCPSKRPTSWRERIAKRVVGGLMAGQRIRIVPNLGGGGIQVIHVSDLVDAFCLALTRSVLGKFNLAADAVSTDMLARVFNAKVRVPLAGALKIHSYARRIGLAAFDPSILCNGSQIPTLDTGRATHDLGWSPKHSGYAVLEEWARSFNKTGLVHPDDPVAVEKDESASTGGAFDYCSLYQRSLDLFGEQVHGIRDDQWADATGYLGWTVWELVSSLARKQYQTALRLRGEQEDMIERQLPADPLGFVRADGWDLAAERGTLAIKERPVDRVERVLPDVIYDLTLSGWFLAETIGFDGATDPELLSFVRERVAAFQGR